MKEREPIFVDSETCGLYSHVVLIQYAIGNGPIELFSVWRHTPKQVMELIEMFVNHPDGVVGFNMTFDWYHLVKIYNIVRLLPYQDLELEYQIDEVVIAEKIAPAQALCLKPVAIQDLWLHALKGPFQSLMEREDVTIRRVPKQIAYDLKDELEARVSLADVYFARRKDYAEEGQWRIKDIEDADGEIDDEFVNVTLAFNPSSGLKALAKATGVAVEGRHQFGDVMLPKEYYPDEAGYRPWGGNWPLVIEKHIDHWDSNEYARDYARDDVVETRALYEYFRSDALMLGDPDPMFSPDDYDSILAINVSNARYKGYAVDLAKLNKLRNEAKLKIENSPMNFNKQGLAKKYLLEVIDPIILASLTNDFGKFSTGKEVLEILQKTYESDVCDYCFGDSNGCSHCSQTGLLPILDAQGNRKPTKAHIRAKEITQYRGLIKQVGIYDKLIEAERFHASFKVIGAKSNRMSGADELNAQGINHSKEMRECFPLAFVPDEELCGGDFDGFEVALMEAAYDDPELRKDLLTTRDCTYDGSKKKNPVPCLKVSGNINPTCPECEGTGREAMKIHGIFGSFLFNMTYDEVLATAKLDGDANKYSRAKVGMFATAYGGTVHTLVKKTGATQQAVDEAFAKFNSKYTKMAAGRQEITDSFTPVVFSNAGTYWRDPAEYIESLNGFRRYFTLENQILRALYDVTKTPPKHWNKLEVRVTRKLKVQKVGNAAISAVFGAIFSMSASNCRAAANHKIQSTGAVLTKQLQRRVWEFQPQGIHPFVVRPMQVHDELMCPCDPKVSKAVQDAVNAFVQSGTSLCPLLKMKWVIGMKDWSGK